MNIENEDTHIIVSKEEYISYWLGALEIADELIAVFASNSKLHSGMRERAINRREMALQRLSKLGYKADVAMEVSRRGFREGNK